MHIKKLEICGFKSFLERTVIHFDHDVVAIVGPNGCGKSNIVDAIRWCMGEQSAKHLRGRSMEDVIFNGSETRGPHGMAEVTITFDNSDLEQAAALPAEYRDYAEIAVTRRLFRDGTSEYLLNKTPVRLRDVVDVFLGTGVGSKAYSIVEQGKIGLIVSARAEDRRLLIEEAAGITKYKARKKAAERKMELTEQNLLRVSDRVGELERNVASLRRQSAKAERYVAYRSEVEGLMLHAASHRLLDLTVRGKYESSAREEADVSAQAVKIEHDVREAELETARADALELEQRTERAQNDAFAADSDVRTLEGEIARAKDRLEHLAARAASARAEQEQLSTQAEALVGERREVAEALARLEGEESDEATSALTQHEALEALRGDERAADAALHEVRTRASQAGARVAAADAKLTGLSRRLDDIGAREGRLAAEAERLATERTELEGRRDTAAAQAETLAAEQIVAKAERARLDTEMAELRSALLVSERTLDESKSALERQRSRLRALEELHARLEGCGDGVKRLLATKDPALLGLVVDRIEASPEITPALVGLLGDALEYVIVDDQERALALLTDLGAKKAGRATVVPHHPRRVAAPTRDELTGEGILGLLVDSLTFADEDEALVRMLVGDAVLVATATAALALAPQAGGRTLVALDGTVVRPDGRISGGAGDKAAEGLVDQHREMRVLRETCGGLEARVTEVVATHQALRSRVSETSAALDAARQRAHQVEISLVTAEKDHRRAEEQLASADRRAGAVAHERDEMSRVLAEAGHERTEAERALTEGRAEREQAELGVADATATALAWREKVAVQLAIVTERKVRLARVREQLAGTRGTLDRLARSIAELTQRVERLEEELVTTARNAGETAATLVGTRERLTDAVTLAQSTQAELSEARRVFDEARTALGEREAAIKALRARVTETAERLAHHELALSRVGIELEHLLAGVHERFRGLDLRTVVGDYHLLAAPDSEHEARTQELHTLIDRMGPVNLDAQAEFKAESDRLEFYTTQKADIDKALADLRRVIGDMNRESRRLFADTFAAINVRFQTVFPKMFRGGRAELRLTQPEDLLETGIEIIAQPPGKKLGNIELMSGGEKALTAVSLIFAIFQHKPSPFCVLDEVDAPLDEANVTRYNEFIREMTDRSQFILITHIKKTMQSVDVLYGVTMQEPGISRLVSVKMDQSAQARSAVLAAKRTTETDAAVA